MPNKQNKEKYFLLFFGSILFAWGIYTAATGQLGRLRYLSEEHRYYGGAIIIFFALWVLFWVKKYWKKDNE